MKQIIIGFFVGYVIIMFIIFIILLISSNKKWRLPPLDCPDFWVKTENGQCYNIHKLQYGTNKVIDYETFDMNDVNGIKSLGIIWDGITYGT